MSPSHHSSGNGYSPDVAIELILHDERFDVASVGHDGVVVRNGRPMQSGEGIILMRVGEQATSFRVRLDSGIIPERREQPLQVLNAVAESAA
jgi:hypothetical protein